MNVNIMSETVLTNENIDLAENFISNNKPIKSHPCLSNRDIESAILAYNKIKKLPPTSYILFGSNALGMVSYGYYKAKNNQIYMINSYCNKITGYCNSEEFTNEQVFNLMH